MGVVDVVDGVLVNPYEGLLRDLNTGYAQVVDLQGKYAELEKIEEKYATLATEIDYAQRLLGTLDEEHTFAALEYVTNTINKVLSELFKGDVRSISLEKTLYQGKHPHISVVLTDGEGWRIDLRTQSGTGLRQMVSFLFLICLVALLKGRRLILMDELLSGVHPEAKREMMRVMELFTRGTDEEDGFQFIMVEYGANDVGRIYNVEKVGKEARVYLLPEDMEYRGESFIFSK